MVAIPGGRFEMGRSDIDINNRSADPEVAWYDLNQYPAHPQSVTDFSMDKTEVTNAEYAEFVKDEKYAAPSHWQGGKIPAGQENWPVTYVSVADALAFARWRSKRDGVKYDLPTEAQWEYVARNGAQETLYPWGNQWKDNCANVGGTSPVDVGKYSQCGSIVGGVLDLIGNVAEWTSTLGAAYPGTPINVSFEGQIIRGGSYSDQSQGDKMITSTRRKYECKSSKDAALGFRLVRNQ